MVDGVLDLLSMVLVLGLVIAVAFGFVLPLMNDEVLEYSSKYEDKAMLGVYETYEEPDNYIEMTRHYYTYEELLLMLAVQDSRMEEPKGVSLRNLVTVYNFNEDDYKYTTHKGSDKNMQNLNALVSTDNVHNVIKLYADNHGSIVANDFVMPTGKKNIGFLKFTEDYPLIVDEMTTKLSEKGEKLLETGTLRDADRVYFIGLQFGVPLDGEYIKNNPNILKDVYEGDMYTIHINTKGEMWKGNLKILDTYTSYQELLNKIRNDTHG